MKLIVAVIVVGLVCLIWGGNIKDWFAKLLGKFIGKG